MTSAIQGLPELQAFDWQRSKPDVLLSAAGFEDRTLALLGLAPESLRGVMGLFLVYRNWQHDNKTAELLAAYRARGLAIRRGAQLSYDRFYPDGFADSLAKALRGTAGTRVLLDITSMSRMAIMLCLDVLRELDVDLTLFYAEAAEYGPSFAEYESAKAAGLPRPSVQVYSGIAAVTRTARLSSVALQGEPSACIAFMSMNEKLTQAIIDALCPSRLFLINGCPPRHEWREEATAWIHEQLGREWPEEDNPIVLRRGKFLPARLTSTLDYRETVTEVSTLYWRLAADYRLILSPTGSKMQAAGAYIVKGAHPDIHIEYPTPDGFLPRYSRGVGPCWMVQFGRFGKLIEGIRARAMREHLFVLA